MANSRSNYPRVLAALTADTDECIIAPGAPTGDGYPRVRVPGGGRVKPYILICTLAHGPRPPGLEAAHSCGNNMCINPRHLRWATKAENQLDRRLHGTDPNGERNGRAKLTWEQIRAIRAEYATGETQHALAVKYGMHDATIWALVTGRTWKE